MTSIAKTSTPVARSLDLAWLLDPLPTAEFFTRHGDKSHLVHSRGNTPRQRARSGRLPACVLLGTLLGFVLTSLAPGQARRGAERELAAILADAGSGGLNQRAAAFNHLLAFRDAEASKYPDLVAQINAGFISLLTWANAAENKYDRAAWRRSAQHPASSGEDPAIANFVGNLVGVVAASGDPRALPVLLDDIESGANATSAIARFGQAATPLLLTALHANSPGNVVCGAPGAYCIDELHSASLRTLTRMAVPSIFGRLRPDGQALVRNLILGSIKSNNPLHQDIGLRGAALLGSRSIEPPLLRVAQSGARPFIRMGATIALGDLRDPSMRAALTAIASSDAGENVREAARLALKKLGSAP